MGNKERKKVRAEHNPPINFTCGLCRKVHKYNPETPLECPDKEVEAVPVEIPVENGSS